MRFFILLALAALTACSQNHFNDTAYPYHIMPEGNTAKNVSDGMKNIIIAPVNYGIPTRKYLEKQQYKVDATVKSYLQDNGFNVLPDYYFENALGKAINEYGRYYDASTGKLNKQRQQQVFLSVLQQLQKSSNADTVIFTDLIEHQISFNANMQHQARFYGVTRKVKLQGGGSSVPTDFDWNQLVDAASLQIVIYDIKGAPLFFSIGGISATQSIDTRKSPPHFKRSRKILNNMSQIEEGVEIAFHPIIVSDDYPTTER